MTGMDRFDSKQRRKMRRLNHIAKDVRISTDWKMHRLEDKRDKYKFRIEDDD